VGTGDDADVENTCRAGARVMQLAGVSRPGDRVLGVGARSGPNRAKDSNGYRGRSGESGSQPLIITVNFEQAASKQGVQQRSTMNRPNSPSAPDYGSGVDPPHGDVRGYFLSEE
jgi:hypothetical protein